jgi:CRP/FNR family transcriptional regulator
LIPLSLMEGLMSGYQSWYRFVVETYRSRFDELLNLIDNTVFKGLDERLEFYLNNQSKSFKTRTLKITHEEIAKDLGTSRVVVSRLLKNMEQRGLVTLHRNQIDLEFTGM